MDDIATVKLRAATPPWQRMDESLWWALRGQCVGVRR